MTTQSLCSFHLAPELKLPMASPPLCPGREAAGCLPGAYSRVWLLTQSLSWKPTQACGKVELTWARLRLLNHVKSKDLPSHQEKGIWASSGSLAWERREVRVSEKENHVPTQLLMSEAHE